MSGAIETLLDKYGTAIELEFVRAPSSLVHIRLPQPPEWAPRPDGERIPAGEVGQAVRAARSQMVCGTRLHEEHQGGPAYAVGTFADEDLCRRCVRGLGPHSVRAFEHPQPGDRTEDDS